MVGGTRARQSGTLRIGWAVWMAIAIGALLAGAGPDAAAAPCATGAPIDARLFLVGDAGAPEPEEPALRAVPAASAAARQALGPERTAIVFLGDNVYPIGLPDPASGGRAKAERRLAALLEQAGVPANRAFLVPGNHDWDNAGDDGWNAVRRQAEWVERAGARLLPREGCPGPASVELGRHLRLVFIDTQWFLHAGPKPRHPDSDCPADSEAEWVASLRQTLAAPGHAIVLAHHPLRTGGPHGGNFGWQEHVFPLRETASWLWAPLPVLGSLYPLVRGAGVSNQDLMGPRYRALRQTLATAFAPAPPLVYAAGHDHGLQVIRGSEHGARWHVGSGSGNARLVSRVREVPGTVFALAASGFARLDVHGDGAVSVSIVLAEPDPEEAFSTCLAAGAP